MKAPLVHVASMIFHEPLAILPEKLEAILRAIGPRLISGPVPLEELAQMRTPLLTGTTGGFGSSGGSNGGLILPGLSGNTGGLIVPGSNSATVSIGSGLIVSNGVIVQARNGDDDGEDEKPYRMTPEGIAIISVRGTLMKRYSWISAASGCSSYAGLRQAATAAMGDPMVKAVLFDIDSPGGTTHGCFELSDAIYQMRGEKPIWGVANDLAASAAYALVSACDRVLLTRTAGVGSVGVFALHADQSAFDEAAGVKFTYIFAGAKKTDGNPHESLSKSARADIQAEVDREYDIFVATVARNRGFAGANVEKIRNTEAGVVFAENALPLLADEVATYEQALEALTKKVSGPRPKTEVVEQKGVEQMAKTEEDKRAQADAAAADTAAQKRDDQDNDDKPQEKKGKAEACPTCHGSGEVDGDECPDCGGSGEAKAKRGGSVREMPVSANAPAKRIAELCQIAGAPELAADYILKGYSVDKVIEKLSARRAKASAEGSVSSYVSGEGNGGGILSVDQAIEQSRIAAANSGGTLSHAKAMERLLRNNPEIYSGYLEERGAVAAQVAFTGAGRALTDYVLNKQRRYMANLGLSTTIDDVPARRAM